jgi:hypothetical protein
MDDVWGDDDDEDENVERETAARDEKNLRQKHYNVRKCRVIKEDFISDFFGD